MLDALPPEQPAIYEPAPQWVRTKSGLLIPQKKLELAALPGTAPMGQMGAGSYGYAQLSVNQFGTPNANQMTSSTSGTSLVTSSHTPTALTENLYAVSCRFNSALPTDLTLTDSLGSTYDVVAGPTVQGTAANGIIHKIFKLRTTTTTARTLTATVTGGGIAASLGFNIERLTYPNPLGLTLITNLVETAQAEGTTVTLNSTPYGDLHECFCISGTNGITTPAGSTRFGNASWSNGGNGGWSVLRNDVPFSLAAGRTRTSSSALRLICHVLHVYFRVIRTKGTATLALTDEQFTASFTTTTRNYTLQIGAAASDRIVIVAIHFSPDSTGSSMPLNAAYADSDTTNVGINTLNALPYSNPIPRTLIYWHKPTGTTMGLTLTLGAAATKVALDVWTLTGAAYAMHTDAKQDAETAAVNGFTMAAMTVKANGGVGVASASRRTGGTIAANPMSWTPSGWVKGSELQAGATNSAMSSASRKNATGSDVSESVAVAFTVNTSNGGSLVGAAFGP